MVAAVPNVITHLVLPTWLWADDVLAIFPVQQVAVDLRVLCVCSAAAALGYLLVAFCTPGAMLFEEHLLGL
jgi:hypothetical protein